MPVFVCAWLRLGRYVEPPEDTMFRIAALPILVTTLFALSLGHEAEAKKKRKKRKKGPPPAGWVIEDEGKPACYHSPAWDSFNEIDRRMKRSEAMDEVLNQWRGQRNDGVQFDEVLIEEVETILLGRPEKIEAFVSENVGYCLGRDASSWKSWIISLKSSLTAGECNTPLDYTMFDYLDIGAGWQRPLKICKGDRIRISGSRKDQYRLSDGSPWINVEGDASKPTSGSEWPCNLEGCTQGMLVMKFVGKGSGIESIVPVGVAAVFTAPEDGEISYRINDTTFFDNVWHKSGSIQDHTSIEVSPAQ